MHRVPCKGAQGGHNWHMQEPLCDARSWSNSVDSEAREQMTMKPLTDENTSNTHQMPSSATNIASNSGQHCIRQSFGTILSPEQNHEFTYSELRASSTASLPHQPHLNVVLQGATAQTSRRLHSSITATLGTTHGKNKSRTFSCRTRGSSYRFKCRTYVRFVPWFETQIAHIIWAVRRFVTKSSAQEASSFLQLITKPTSMSDKCQNSKCNQSLHTECSGQSRTR